MGFCRETSMGLDIESRAGGEAIFTGLLRALYGVRQVFKWFYYKNPEGNQW